MVQPVTGPFQQEFGRNSEQLFWWRRSYRQAKPFTKRLPFIYEQQKRVQFSESGAFLNQSNPTLPLGWTEPGPLYGVPKSSAVAHAKAFKKFQAKLGETSELMVTMIERRKSLDMIANRADAIRTGFEAIRRGRSPKGWPRDPAYSRFRGSAKDAGSKYLEYHFGWEPLVKDIYSAVQVLQSPCPPTLVKASGQSGRSTAGWPLWAPITSPNQTRYWDAWEVSCQLIADVTVVNPLLWRANQLGLINPASWAWELVRLSWLVDWFVNVGDFLGGFTAFSGLQLSEPATTYFTKRTSARWRTGSSIPQDVDRLLVDMVIVQRTTGIGGPSLHLKPFRGLSVSRATTSVAYLVQFLKSVR
jgi:hypothetical protein